jgi:hypothetical protein
MAMASGKTSTQDVDPAIQELWRLSRREDLADAFGIMLSIPWHGQDSQGVWRFGLNPMGGMPNMEWQNQFESEMKELIRGSAFSLVSRGLLTQDETDALDSHPYSVGPAAQEWPKIFFDLYQDARPFLNDGASILGWGYFFRDLIGRLWTWAANKQREQSEYPEAENVTYSGHGVVPTITLTRPAIVALCYAHLVDQHGVSEEMTVETFPRSFTSYATPDHPGGQETYLVQARAGRRSFFFHVSGTGEVAEHYLIVGITVTPLPLPNFVGDEFQSSSRESFPSQRIVIKVR